jgi:hypothetical protein
MVFSKQHRCSQLFETLRLNVAMGGTFGLCCDLGESSAWFLLSVLRSIERRAPAAFDWTAKALGNSKAELTPTVRLGSAPYL